MAIDYLNPTAQGTGALSASATPTAATTTAPTTTAPTGTVGLATSSATTGALSSGVTSTNPTSLTTAPMGTATTWTPSESDLASSRLTSMLSSDSPYLTRARTRASQYAASRGLLNSSIAATAGEAAAIDAAAPLAQADAATLAKAGEFNAGAQNTFTQQANDFQRQGALAQYDAMATAEQGRLQREATASESALQRTESARQFDAAQAFDREQLAATTTQQNADRQVGVSDRIAALQQNAMQQIAEIDRSGLDAAGKAAAMQRVWDQLDSAITLAVMESGVTMPDTWRDYIGIMQPTVGAAAAGTSTTSPQPNNTPGPNNPGNYPDNPPG